MACRENLIKLQNFLGNLHIDLGEGLVIIHRCFGWQWGDPKPGDSLRAPEIPDVKIDMVMDFFRCNYRSRLKITAPDLHRRLLVESPDYAREYDADCRMNFGKPWSNYVNFPA